VLGQPFDTRSDIFALGLMLYEFACGKYPFSSDPGLIPREIVHSEPESLRKLDPQVPAELEQLVVLALKKDPAERLQTAEEFASGLYLAAQQLRRVASATLAGQSSSAAQMPVEPIANQLPPALTPEPVMPRPTFPAALEPPPVELNPPPVLESQIQAPAPKVRERPQDAEPAPQPWTARSYSAGAPLPGTSTPKQPAVQAAVQQPFSPPEPPVFQPPQSFLKPAALPKPVPVQPKISKTAKRVLTAAAGLILAAGIVGSLVSRQNLRASQNRSHAVAPAPEAVAPVGKPSSPPAPAAPVARAPKPEEPAPEEVVNPEISAKQILNGPVRTLWESGRYAQAMALVNRVLVQDPGDEDARSWKTKIREAQAAEAALK
jgi:serine/threonine protein kinase